MKDKRASGQKFVAKKPPPCTKLCLIAGTGLPWRPPAGLFIEDPQSGFVFPVFQQVPEQGTMSCVPGV
jgi:hypothetical protein